MTDEQFKELMGKLDRIEREMKSGKWVPLFKPPLPWQPQFDHTGAPPHWEWNRAID